MNVLIVGLGSIATKHIVALKALNFDTTIYALRSNKEAGLVDGIINIYNLSDIDVDFEFAIISNPTQLHYEYINLLVDKGFNLFIEKPPVNTLDNIDELINKINFKNTKTYVACNLRFHPCLVFIKDFLDQNPSKIINEVNVYCGSYLPDWRPNKDFRKTYSAIPEMGGGVHLDLYHELDYTHWLFGKPIRSSSIKTNKSSLNIAAFDYANYVLEYEKFTANLILNYYRRDAKRTIEIVFDNQTITIDLIKNIIFNHQNEIIFNPEKFEMIDTYKDQMRFFVNTLKINQKQMNTFADSVTVLKTCLNNE